MLIAIESKDFSLLGKAMTQLREDFIQCNPNGVVSEDPDLSKVKGTEVTLVVLREPYRLVDCMSGSSTEAREFVYQVMEYLHQDYHHLAISISELRIMNKRLRVFTSCRIVFRRTRFRVLYLTSGIRTKSGIPNKDNLWKIITTPPEALPEINLEPDEDIENKILVTLETKSGREDYLVTPEEPFIIKDGRTLTVIPPEDAGILF